MQNIVPSKFLKIDVIIQRVFLVLIVFGLFVFPISMLLSIPFGAWQVISGVVGALYGSQWRKKYLGVVAIYFMSYPFVYYLSDVIGRSMIFEYTFGAIYVITPIVLGLTYYIKSEKEYPKNDPKQTLEEHPDILDVEMTY